MLSATFGINFPKKEAWNRGTGGRSTFWPTGCVIFCWKGRHCLPSWCHHRLQWLPSQRDLATQLPRKSDRSAAELGERRQSHTLMFGKYL